MFARFSRTALAVLLPLSVATAACGGSVATEQPASTAEAATRAPVAVSSHGPARVIGQALGDVPLRPSQRSEIEKLATDSESRHAAVLSARKDLQEAIAVQVEAGKIDRAALQPKIDAVATAMDAARPADRAAFERLHAILDADQRVQFVDAFRAQMKAHHHPGGPDGEQKADQAEGHHGHFGMMKQWAADLKLTDEQKAQIKDAMRARFQQMRAQHGPEDHKTMADMKARGDKMLDAFKSDHFVMDEVAPKMDVHAAAGKMSDRMLGMLETVLPILTPEQRTIAAQKIRAHSEHVAPAL